MANINDILGIAESYRNTVEHSAKHREILSIYNNHRPLARGYKVTENDAWCMTFISALFIKGNAVDAIGITECGCQEYVNYAKKQQIKNRLPCVIVPFRFTDILQIRA